MSFLFSLSLSQRFVLFFYFLFISYSYKIPFLLLVQKSESTCPVTAVSPKQKFYYLRGVAKVVGLKRCFLVAMGDQLRNQNGSKLIFFPILIFQTCVFYESSHSPQQRLHVSQCLFSKGALNNSLNQERLVEDP